MSPIRVFVSATSHVLREILVDAVSAEADMVVVGEPPDTDHLVRATDHLIRAVHAAEPDVLVVSTSTPAQESKPDGAPLASTALKVLAIVEHDRNGQLYELRPCTSLMGDVSPPSLVEAIRTAAAGGEAPPPSAGER